MKNIMKNNNILSALTGLLVVSFLVVGAFSVAPLAHAQEFDGGYDFGIDGGGGCCGGDTIVPSSIDYPYNTIAPSSIDYPQYDYSQPYSPGYMDYGYMGGGYLGGSYLGGSYLGGGSYLPTSGGGNFQTQSQSQAQVSNNTNTNVNNNIITIGAQTQQTPVCANGYSGTYPNCYLPQPVCQSGYYGTYPNCYHQVYNQPPVYQNPPIVYQHPPIAYNNPTPYVSLSAVPYTGLDLGFWGTIAYWGFLILWCLVAAYLVVVKKVQNRIFRSLSNFLFGNYAASHTTALTLEGVRSVASDSAQHVSAPVAAPVVSQVDAIDDFILSQINRARA